MSFWTGSLSKSVKTCEERPTFAIPIIFFLNIYFSAKNYLLLYAKQSKSGSESSVSCHDLKQGSEMRIFCRKQGRGLLASAAHLYTNFPWVSPPPFPPDIFNLARWCSIDQVLVTRSSNESNFTGNKINIFKHGKDTCRWGNMDAVICDKHLSSNFSVVRVCKMKVCPLKNSAARVNLRNRSLKIWLRGLGNKAKEMYYSLLSLKTISFFFIPPSLATKYEF